MERPEPPSHTEELLLSKIHLQVQYWNVHGQQTAYAGHTCLFSRDNAAFLNILPLLPEHLDVLILRDASASPTHITGFGNRAEFHVKRQRLLDNLVALQRFHPSYRDIIISHDNLASLPEDGSVFHRLRSATQASDPNVTTHTAPDSGPHAGNLPEANNDIVSAACVPNLMQPGMELDDARAALGHYARDDDDEEIALAVPLLGSQPVNEHDQGHEYLIEAFPFLFPSGVADLHAHRIHAVPPDEYFRHLLRYKDGRFVTDPRFRFYAFNALLRWQAKKMSSFLVSRNEEDRGLSAGDLRDLAQSDARSLLDRVRRGGHQLRGTAPYWHKRSTELNAMVQQLGTPNAFLTLTAADLHWPDLHRHMPPPDEPHVSETARQRHNSKNVNNNPAITAWYFQKRFQLFFEHVIKPVFRVKEWWFRYEWQSRGSSHVHGLIWMDGAPDPSTLGMTCLGMHSLNSGINTSQLSILKSVFLQATVILPL